MKRKRFTPEQISAILRDYNNGIDMQTIVREHGVSKAIKLLPYVTPKVQEIDMHEGEPVSFDFY